MQRVALINGENINQDYDLLKIFQALATSGVAEGLEVQNGVVTPGFAFINIVRDGITFPVLFQNTSNLTLDTTGTKKVFIELDQVKIDDGSENNSDGTGIGEIKTGNTYPSSNFLKLASINSGVITDEREFITTKDYLKITKMGNVFNGANQLIKTDSQGKIPVLDGSNIIGLKAEVSSTTLKHMLGQSILAGKGVSLSGYEQLLYENPLYFGSVSRPFVGQKIYGQGIINSIKLMIKKIGSTDDSIFLEIQTDNNGLPSGTVVPGGTSNTIPYTSINTTIEEKTFIFAGVCNLENEKVYHIVIKRTGPYSDVNRYEIGRTTVNSDFIGKVETYDGTSWADAVGDIYLKIPTYKLLTLGGTNFLGILQLDGIAGQIRNVNTSYDNHQTGLVKGNYYTYDGITGVIKAGYNFRAISDSEISFDLSTMGTDLFYGNGSAGDLEVLSGTATIAFGVYNYSSVYVASGATLNVTGINGVLELNCNRYCRIEGTLNLDGLGNNGNYYVYNGKSLQPGSPGTGGNGGKGGGSSINGFLDGSAGGTGNATGYGGGGGGGAADSNSGGVGGIGGYPGGLGGYGSCGNSGGNAYGNPGGNASWNGTSTINSGGLSAGGSGGCSNGAGGGGGGGGIVGNSGGNLVIRAYEIRGSGIISLKGTAGGNGGKGGDANGTSGGGGGGGGAGGGGAGGSGMIICSVNSSSYSVLTTGGIGGTGGAGGTVSGSYSPVAGTAGTVGGTGTAGVFTTLLK